MSRVLVVGGAGYIGSHMVRMLAQAGHAPVTFDHLEYGHRDAVLAGEFVEGSLHDAAALASVFRAHRFDAVIHFAAYAYVRESVDAPRKYYENNVRGSMALVHAMLDAGVRRLVFSSTCATYGEVAGDITEETPQAPINPYGRTKLVVEGMLQDYARAYGLESISLRYFNAAGASEDGALVERHEPEPHLIPLVLREAERVLSGGDPADTRLEVFGTDFPTPDGSCVRDYVHVEDLCCAHLLALDRLSSGACAGAEAYNLASEHGHSVIEIIEAAMRVTGAPLVYRVGPRKPGDPARLVASSKKAREVLGWAPRLTRLDDVLRTAWHASYPHRRA